MLPLALISSGTFIHVEDHIVPQVLYMRCILINPLMRICFEFPIGKLNYSSLLVFEFPHRA